MSQDAGLIEPIILWGLDAGRAMVELGGGTTPPLDSRTGVCTCRACEKAGLLLYGMSFFGLTFGSRVFNNFSGDTSLTAARLMLRIQVSRRILADGVAFERTQTA